MMATVAIAGQATGAERPADVSTEVEGTCNLVPSPPVRLETASKYDQGVSSKSVIDDSASAARRQVLAPIEDAVRRLEAMVAAQAMAVPQGKVSSCAGRSLETWAQTGALTDMATKDANLSRDRLMVSIAASLAALKLQGDDLSTQPIMRAWLTDIARQTIYYYDREAGPISRRNNHRYWAALSVGQIGAFLGDVPMAQWAKEGLDIGLCQVDAEGFMPLELARGKKALDYHVFSFVALRSLSDLLTGEAQVSQSSCAAGLTRLQARVETGLADIASFEMRSGIRQDTVSRRNVTAAERLFATPDGVANKGT
jgi:hypothetical protein